MKHRAIHVTISKYHALTRLGGHTGGGSTSAFGWRNSYLITPFGQRHTSPISLFLTRPALHVLHPVLKLPGLAGALVVAGDSSRGVGGARIVSFPSFFFVASVSQWVFLVGGKEP
jgi:hypothetical protein